MPDGSAMRAAVQGRSGNAKRSSSVTCSVVSGGARQLLGAVKQRAFREPAGDAWANDRQHGRRSSLSRSPRSERHRPVCGPVPELLLTVGDVVLVGLPVEVVDVGAEAFVVGAVAAVELVVVVAAFERLVVAGAAREAVVVSVCRLAPLGRGLAATTRRSRRARACRSRSRRPGRRRRYRTSAAAIRRRAAGDGGDDGAAAVQPLQAPGDVGAKFPLTRSGRRGGVVGQERALDAMKQPYLSSMR